MLVHLKENIRICSGFSFIVFLLSCVTFVYTCSNHNGGISDLHLYHFPVIRGAFGKFLAWSFISVTDLLTLSCLVSF